MGSGESAAGPAMEAAPATGPRTHVVLLGDSTIDNVCWTGHPHEVPAKLKELLPDAKITNFAADGFTSTDLLEGACPAISWAKRQEVGDPFPALCGDRIFKPLDELAKLSPPPTHAVLSIGGNDVREILGSIDQLPHIVARFQANYTKILDRLCRAVPNVVIQFQYRPGFRMDHSYGVYQAMERIPGPGDSVAKINHLMETVYQPVLLAARERRLPIVDLPRTFDIYDDELYCCQIEPSAKGGALIAQLLSHAVRQHDFSGPPRFYLLQGGAVLAEANDGSVHWTIPQ